MTTRINVFVGRPDLPQRAGQRQQSARLTQADKEAQRRTATQAVDAAIAAGLVSAPTAAARRALITNAERQLRLGNTTRLVPGLGALRPERTRPILTARGQRGTHYLDRGYIVIHDEPAANRRPEEAGTTGLVWRAQPPRPDAFFSASYLWMNLFNPGDPRVYWIDENDRYTYSIGSGDGSRWLVGTLAFGGIQAFRQNHFDFFANPLPAPPGLPPNPAGPWSFDPTGMYYSPDFQFIDDSQLVDLCLPCGNGNAIVVVAGRAAGSWIGSKVVITEATEINGFWFSSIANRQLQISEVATVAANDIQAYVVSQTDCRQITVPQELRSTLEDLLLTTDLSNPIPWYPTGTNVQATIYAPTGPDAYWYSDGIYRYRKYDYVRTLDLYKTYGASADVMEIEGQYGVITPNAHTPASTVPLTKSQEVFALTQFPYEENPIDTYVEGRERLRSLGAPAPTHVVGFDVRLPDYQAFQAAVVGSEPGYEDASRWETLLYNDPRRLVSDLTPVRSNTQPEGFYDRLPQAGAWQSLRRLTLDPSRVPRYGADTYYEMLWHYDWAQPAYCRQQLLSLGFTEADLQP